MISLTTLENMFCFNLHLSLANPNLIVYFHTLKRHNGFQVHGGAAETHID